mgnify:CR=1 FL=1
MGWIIIQIKMEPWNNKYPINEWDSDIYRELLKIIINITK